VACRLWRCARGADGSGPRAPAPAASRRWRHPGRPKRVTDHRPGWTASPPAIGPSPAPAASLIGEGAFFPASPGQKTRVSRLPGGFPAELVEAVDDRPPAIGHHIRRAAVRLVPRSHAIPTARGAALPAGSFRRVRRRFRVAPRFRQRWVKRTSRIGCPVMRRTLCA
jgi:hypothetical protein